MLLVAVLVDLMLWKSHAIGTKRIVILKPPTLEKNDVDSKFEAIAGFVFCAFDSGISLMCLNNYGEVCYS
jgi:hypothetical protein